MVFPLIALFLGTGNQTANVSCAILERQFNDPNMKLWDFDSDTQLPNLPAMFTFPNLHDFYEDWRRNLESKGVEVRLRTDVAEILQRNGQGIVLATRPFDAEANDWKGEYTGPASKTETFDELVMCVLADDTLKLLGRQQHSRRDSFSEVPNSLTTLPSCIRIASTSKSTTRPLSPPSSGPNPNPRPNPTKLPSHAVSNAVPTMNQPATPQCTTHEILLSRSSKDRDVVRLHELPASIPQGPKC